MLVVVAACIVAALVAMGQLVALLLEERRLGPLPGSRRAARQRRNALAGHTSEPLLAAMETVPPADAAADDTAAKSALPLRILEGAVLTVVLGATLVAALIVIGPRLFPYQVLVVRSGSMSPTIPTGSVVIYRKVDAERVRPGQIILYNEPGDVGVDITHRVVKVLKTPSGRYFVTKGDANASPDPWHVKASGVGWVVSGHVPYLGYALVYLESTPARLLLVTLPALGLGLIFLLESWEPKRRSSSLANEVPA